MRGCLWTAGQSCSWTSLPVICCQKGCTLLLCSFPNILQTMPIVHQSDIIQELHQADRERKPKRWRDSEQRPEEQMTELLNGWLDGVGRQVVWGQSISHDIFFYFIDMHPGEVNAIMARAHRCLLAGQLIGLAFDPLAHSEGWGEGVMRAPVAAIPFAPHPSSVLLIPSSNHLSIPSTALYPSLSCFPHKCLLKNPCEVEFYEV